MTPWIFSAGSPRSPLKDLADFKARKDWRELERRVGKVQSAAPGLLERRAARAGKGQTGLLVRREAKGGKVQTAAPGLLERRAPKVGKVEPELLGHRVARAGKVLAQVVHRALKAPRGALVRKGRTEQRH